MPIFSSMEPQVTALRAPSVPSALTRNFGTTNSVMPLMPAGRTLDAGQHEMDDVLGEVVLARRDEDLGAGDLVAAVGLFHGLGAQQAEIRAAMRLGQVHGAGPRTRDETRQIDRLLLRRAMAQQCRDRALRQARIHGERHVGAAQELADDGGEQHRQALAAELGRSGDAHPAALGVLLIGVLEAGGRGDPTVGVARAAFLVADAVERLQHLLRELRRLVEDRLDDIRRSIGEARQVVVALELGTRR